MQLFGEGGAASAGAAATGTDGGMAATSGVSDSPESNGSEDLSKVIYGKSDQDLANPNIEGEKSPTPNPEDKAKTFENMIKKNGEYHEEFTKRTQDIIDKRFKQTKQLEDQINSFSPIMDVLSMKYGIDAKDIEGLTKAIQADDSLIEEEAFKQGLTAEQYRYQRQIEKENEALKAAREQADQDQAMQRSFAQWQSQADEMCAKYGIENFDLSIEAQNPDFVRLLGNGIDLETAYMVIHRNEVINNAMSVAARETKKAVVNNISQRASRPSESGVDSSGTNSIFKVDPSKFTNADLDEVKRRVQAGEKIRF